MDKLAPVREVLTQAHDDWKEWKLQELTDNLRKYVERNPLHDGEDQQCDNSGRERYREISYCWEMVIKASMKASEPRRKQRTPELIDGRF